MKYLYSELIGVPLVDRETGKGLGRVFDLLMDPDRGTLMALKTTRVQVIAPVDLGEFKEDAWEVRSEDAGIDESELVRLQAIAPARRKLIHKKVFTKSGDDLGIVEDFMLDMTTLSLVQLVVAKRTWLFRVSDLIIGWNQILEITEQAVIVKDHHIKGLGELEEYWKLKEKIRAPLPS